MKLSMRSLAGTMAITAVSTGVWTIAFSSIARADDVQAEGREVTTFTERARAAVATPAASVSHVQVCDARMVTCGAPVALSGRADRAVTR